MSTVEWIQALSPIISVFIATAGGLLWSHRYQKKKDEKEIRKQLVQQAMGFYESFVKIASSFHGVKIGIKMDSEPVTEWFIQNMLKLNLLRSYLNIYLKPPDISKFDDIIDKLNFITLNLSTKTIDKKLLMDIIKQTEEIGKLFQENIFKAILFNELK